METNREEISEMMGKLISKLDFVIPSQMMQGADLMKANNLREAGSKFLNVNEISLFQETITVLKEEWAKIASIFDIELPGQVLRKPKKRDKILYANWYLSRNRKKIEELDLEILRMIEDSDGILSDEDLLIKLCGKRIGVKRELHKIKTRLMNKGYVSNMPISDMSHITSIGRDVLENDLNLISDRSDIAQAGNQSPISQIFKVGHSYSRQKDLHDKYGGNRQSGISQCAFNPYIFLFHTPRSSEYEYKDGWISDDTYIYSGEGRAGDMDFTRGNQAILEHSRNHKELHLFQQISSGTYKYVGQFRYDRHEIDIVKKTNETPRKMIRFVLKRV